MHTPPTTLNFFSRPPPRLLRARSHVSSGATYDIDQYLNLNQRRYFLNPSSLDGIFSTSPPLRRLTHSRVLPYPRSSVFRAIISIERYPSFLPFVLSANVSQVDENKLPSRARLKVGYDNMGIEENWNSIVNAEEDKGLIEARSADAEDGQENGLFEVLKTRWQLQDLESVRTREEEECPQTAVRLDVEVKFRSAIYDKLFSGVEEKVAGIMVGAFEKRIKELATS